MQFDEVELFASIAKINLLAFCCGNHEIECYLFVIAVFTPLKPYVNPRILLSTFIVMLLLFPCRMVFSWATFLGTYMYSKIGWENNSTPINALNNRFPMLLQTMVIFLWKDVSGKNSIIFHQTIWSITCYSNFWWFHKI